LPLIIAVTFNLLVFYPL